jgi:hypothetical protein
MIKLRLGSLAFGILAFTCAPVSYGQSGSGTIKGTVLDPSGAAIKSATVAIQNPVSHYQQSIKTDA